VDGEDDEGFVDQLDFILEKLKELAIQILAGKDIVLIRLRNGEWLEAAIPQYIVEELQ